MTRLPFHLQGVSLSEDVDTTYSFIFTECDQNLRALRGCYEGLKPPKTIGTKIQKYTGNHPSDQGECYCRARAHLVRQPAGVLQRVHRHAELECQLVRASQY